MIRPNIIRTRGGATLGQTFASLAYYGYITNSLIHPREKSQSLDIPTVTKPPVFYTRDTCQGPVSLLHPHPFRFDKELKRPRTGAPCLLPSIAHRSLSPILARKHQKPIEATKLLVEQTAKANPSETSTEMLETEILTKSDRWKVIIWGYRSTTISVGMGFL